MEAIKVDEALLVQSEYTSAALKTAMALEEWWKKSEESYQHLSTFSPVLTVRLGACFASKWSTLQLKKENMWGAYHRLRTVDSFVCDWRVFLAESVQCKAFPAFYQYITQHIFKTLIKKAYLVRVSVHDESPDRPLTSEEQNALRYVAGYVVRKLRNKFESESPRNDEHFFCLWSVQVMR